ncbi:cytochrome P450 2G1-like [Hyperolius riggenbachi]|uniref:cytochrome P450 2G1-like n=1 Tax=Hyperolius riggenbachi TaxID=752182 RepID=UPI0035A3B41C
MEFTSDVTLHLALALCAFLSFISLRWFRRSVQLPPGPTPLPLIGNILQLSGGNFVTLLLKLKEKYGDVLTIYMGSRPVVVVTGYDAVREVYIDRADDFLARGDIFSFNAVYKNYGVALTGDLHRWKRLRQFSLVALRDLGMGKRKIEDRIQEEAQCLVDELKRANGSYFDPRHLLTKVSINIIHSIMFGKRLDYESKQLIKLLHCLNEVFSIISSVWGQLFEMFPGIMRFLPGQHHKMFSDLEELLHYVREKVKINRETLDPNNPRDYVDTFLIKMEKDSNNPQSDYSLSNLEASTVQLFFAGGETTSTTLTYAFLILLKYPEVLAKVNDEIEHVIGHDRIPKVQDRNQMPYTEAVLHEIQRFIDILPVGVPRKTTRDVVFRGHFLPKDVNVYVVLSSVLKDPTCFSYPNEFNPKNFLDENGGFKKNDAFMPLAAGKRNCMGEALARMEIFLFIITILQNFTLKSDISTEELDVNPILSGLGNVSKPYKLSFTLR